MDTYRKIIAEYIGFPMQDLIKKTNIRQTLSLLKESQYWDEARIREYQFAKLTKLIEFAYRNVPYYENLFNEIKLKPSDIKQLEDFKKIPILTKEIARKENKNLVARNFNMKHVKKGKTGGTTGVPITVLKDIQNRSFTWASYYRWYEWMGIDYTDKELTFWGSRTVLNTSMKKSVIDFTSRFLQNNLMINAFKLNDEDLNKIYYKIIKFKPVIIKGYLSSLLDLAHFMERNSLTGIHPKVLSSTSEMLLPHNRSYIEKIFNAPVFDQYGCGEISAISYECAKHNGLHINQEHIICEILDTNNQPIIDQSGRIIATDLDNFVMPFIRYENGDLGTLSTHKCSCGVNQPLMSSIDGRTIDTIALKNGRKVHGVFFTDIFYELGILTDKIQRFQIRQIQPGVVKFIIETPKKLDPALLIKLNRTLLPFFDKLDLIESTHIPTDENGKFKYLINEFEKN